MVTDRFSGSTLAYQGYGRGLDVAELARVVSWATAGLVADLSILIDVPLPVARSRLATGRPDRLERLDEDFHLRVARRLPGPGGRPIRPSGPWSTGSPSPRR